MIFKDIEIAEVAVKDVYDAFNNIQDWAKHPNLGGYLSSRTGALVIPVQEGRAAQEGQILVIYPEPQGKITLRFGDHTFSTHLTSFPICSPVSVMLLKARILEAAFRDSWKEFLKE